MSVNLNFFIQKKLACTLAGSSKRRKIVLISGMLNLVKKNLSLPGIQSTAEINQSDSHLKSLAVIHELFYKSKDLTRINFSDYIGDLINMVILPLLTERKDITIRVQAVDIFMDIDSAILCSSLVNELVLNSLSHAFPPGHGGEILIELGTDDLGRYRLVVQDNGIGLPFDIISGEKSTPGLNLVQMLVHQLRGSMNITQDRGTAFNIIFVAPQ
jgi:two-component sensor histidine kinase